MFYETKPREQSGRDAFSRFNAQIRSAAMASLEILEGKSVDKVFCDFHDDFVVRQNDGNNFSYNFFQVKTKSKQNQNWTVNAVSGIKIKKNEKPDIQKIKDSFIGKLLLHTVLFRDQCKSVIFQTNVNNHDELELLFEDIKNDNFSNKHLKILTEKFNEIFSGELGEDEKVSEEFIVKSIKKLDVQTDVEYLKNDKDVFESVIRNRIHKYSEIDLSILECQEIILKLLNLVKDKTSGVIEILTQKNIDESAGVAVNDLLKILSITFSAYQILVSNGDHQAIKSVSIIQRNLKKSGASEEVIEYCTKNKAEWDIWLRKTRHTVPERELNFILTEVRELLHKAKGELMYIDFPKLRTPIKDYYKMLKDESREYGLNEDLILGGIFSELIRNGL